MFAVIGRDLQVSRLAGHIISSSSPCKALSDRPDLAEVLTSHRPFLLRGPWAPATEPATATQRGMTLSNSSAPLPAINSATAAQLNLARSGHTATRLPDGRVLIAGGENSSGVLNSTEIFDPAAG